MDIKIPIRLERDPIVESIFEIRFSSDEPLVSEVLPGMIFQELRSDFPQVVNLPIKGMPVALRQQDPELCYQPLVSLQGENRRINIGDRVVSLAITRPYIGWVEKKKLLSTLLDFLEQTSLVTKIERYSLKYVNIVPSATKDDSDTIYPALKVDIQLGEFLLSKNGSNIRAEIEVDGITNIVNISPRASYGNGDDVLKGALVDVDSIKLDVDDSASLKDVIEGADALHSSEKQVFFGLLKEDTVENMGPVWE